MMYLPRDLTRLILEMVQGKTWEDCIIESFTEVVEIQRRGVVRCPRNVTTIDLYHPLGGQVEWARDTKHSLLPSNGWLRI